MRALSAATAADAGERNWSTYSFIVNRNRDFLKPERVDTPPPGGPNSDTMAPPARSHSFQSRVFKTILLKKKFKMAPFSSKAGTSKI